MVALSFKETINKMSIKMNDIDGKQTDDLLLIVQGTNTVNVTDVKSTDPSLIFIYVSSPNQTAI